MLDLNAFRNAMALLGGAVSIITTAGAAGRYGFTATAVCSVTDQPPTLLVCMNRGSYANAFFKANGVLAVNLLAAPGQRLSQVFADKQVGMEARFEQAAWVTGSGGSPLLQGALASFDCRIRDSHEVGSHDIFYCEILGLQLEEQEPQGLIYFNRAYHHLDGATARAQG